MTEMIVIIPKPANGIYFSSPRRIIKKVPQRLKGISTNVRI